MGGIGEEMKNPVPPPPIARVLAGGNSEMEKKGENTLGRMLLGRHAHVDGNHPCLAQLAVDIRSCGPGHVYEDLGFTLARRVERNGHYQYLQAQHPRDGNFTSRMVTMFHSSCFLYPNGTAVWSTTLSPARE